MAGTLLGYDEIFLQHRTGEQHPERPARLSSIMQALRGDPVWDELVIVPPVVASEAWVETIHSRSYIHRLREACRGKLPFIDSHDSAICPDSYQVALQAVSVTLTACDMILSGQGQNGFCPLRPPGHHAERNESLGFCLFNNVAIAAKYIQKQHHLKRILILDWDAHHGNGTQHSFYRDDTVFYASLHQHPATLFPGTGWPNEFGEGPGRGYNLNMPMEPGAGDDLFLDLFHTNFLPLAREFRPDFVLVSAGFDGHRGDPLCQLNLSERAYREIDRETLRLAGDYCQGRFLSVLEGGYRLADLSRCALGHVRSLAEQSRDKN